VLHFTLPWVLRIPTLIALTFGVSVCSYAVIERPFLRLKRFFEPLQHPSRQVPQLEKSVPA